MRKLLLLGCFILLFGCATTGETIHCPQQDVVVKIRVGFLTTAVSIPKGYFDMENEGTLWITQEEFNKLQEQQQVEEGTECCPDK